MKLSDIQVGRTYRYFSCTGEELKPRTVTYYNKGGALEGGTVRAHSGRRSTGKLSQTETFSGSYFIKRVRNK